VEPQPAGRIQHRRRRLPDRGPVRRCGIDLVATFSGNSTYDQFANAHMAKLNCVMCHRSINYVADMIEKKYGTPWIKVNFIGAGATAKSLRKIAEYFEDDE
jgi:nitrogenase molybdenum-iron protein alpha chain